MRSVSPRLVNLALLALLVAALVTGALAFAVGSGWSVWVVGAHGAVGLGILLLAPWKSAIARRGIRRRRGRGSWASIAFAWLVLASIAAGVGHATGILRTVGFGVTAMQVHVASALLAIPFFVWHVVTRPATARRTDLSRRTLLRSGALVAGSLAAYGGLVGLVWGARLPGRGSRFTGSYRDASAEPNGFPVTQWLFDGVPSVDASAWRLTVGRDGRDIARFALADLDGRREPVRGTIDCTGGWYAERTWEGVRLDRLLDDAGGGRSVEVGSVTGYGRRFPLADASRLWLATRVGGVPLSAGHGFPVRLVAPERRGFWWVKWVSRVEVSDTPWWLQAPFPLS